MRGFCKQVFRGLIGFTSFVAVVLASASAYAACPVPCMGCSEAELLAFSSAERHFLLALISICVVALMLGILVSYWFWAAAACVPIIWMLANPAIACAENAQALQPVFDVAYFQVSLVMVVAGVLALLSRMMPMFTHTTMARQSSSGF